MEILRADETELFTQVRPGLRLRHLSRRRQGVAFPRHQTDNFVCLAGMIKLVLIDTRDGSPTKGAVNEFFLGTEQRAAGAGAVRSSTTAGSASAPRWRPS